MGQKRITVTQKDIDTGCETSILHLNCPWARAIDRRLRKGYIASVGRGSWGISSAQDITDEFFGGNWPDSVVRWITRHDNILFGHIIGEMPKPMSVIIEYPDEFEHVWLK